MEALLILLELLCGIGLFIITGLSIAKITMCFNPDPTFGDEQ